MASSGGGPLKIKLSDLRRYRTLVIPVIIIIGGLAAAALTPISTGELVSVCAGSQVPVYVAGLAAGIKILPTLSRSWWAAVVATTAVAFLLIPAGRYLLIPTVIATYVIARHAQQRRSACAVSTQVDQCEVPTSRLGRPHPVTRSRAQSGWQRPDDQGSQ